MKNINKKIKRKQMLVTRRNRYGYLFVAPFAIGLILFILLPIIQSIVFSLSDLNLTLTGYELDFAGLKSYNRALFIDANIRRLIVNALIQTFTDLPVILAFSFFAALLLKNPFPGRSLARAIFFLPVIMVSGVIASIDSANLTLATMMNRNTADLINGTSGSFSANKMILSLFNDAIPATILAFLGRAVDGIFDVIMASGLQIIIFIGGLNTISASIYEASSIEGATAWESFWKITFPIMGPYLLLNTIYTIIDSFINIKNPLILTIQNYLLSFSEFSFGSAISWIYFGLVLMIIGIAMAILSKRVFYYD
ncbi:MAG TPA: sugar ABC transporter permease [Clostridiales bacterium]|nr:sugar ABC transporter permease [Clostridiales bacterium]